MFFLPLTFFFQMGAFAQNETPAGTVIATQGKVTAIGAGNTLRTLSRGAQVFEKDMILVGTASAVQVKFTDGGLLNLIEQTEYKIETYSYKNKGRKDESVGDLVKGGFRSLSGGISKTAENASTVKTPVGTMGVRGTVMSARILKGKVYYACTHGKVKLFTAITKGSAAKLSTLDIGPSEATRYAARSFTGESFDPLTVLPPALAGTEFQGPTGSFSIDGGTSESGFQDTTEMDWDAGEC